MLGSGSAVRTKEKWHLPSWNLETRAEFSNMVATSHVWLFQFKLIKMKYNLRFSFSVTVGTFLVLSSRVRLAAAMCIAQTARLHRRGKPSRATLDYRARKLLLHQASVVSFVSQLRQLRQRKAICLRPWGRMSLSWEQISCLAVWLSCTESEFRACGD